jgi:uncharacterized protein YkwD
MFTLMLVSLISAADTQEYHPTFVKMVQAANAERARIGRPPVRIAPGLMTASANHTKQMVTTGNLRHSQYRVAEIIAAGQRNVPEVIRSWMRSPGHRAVLTGNYRYVGAAAYMMKGGGTRYWTMQFSNTAYGAQSQQQAQQPRPPTQYQRGTPSRGYSSGGS